DERKLATLAGGKVRRADAETVKRATGYTIGGVPPLALETALPIWADEDLLRHDLIYAAAGVPECVFPLTPDELLRATGGRVADVSRAGDNREAVAQTGGRWGRLDVLYANAGVPQWPTAVEEMDESAFDRIMAVNVKGVFLGVKFAVPVMKKQKSGVILITGS